MLPDPSSDLVSMARSRDPGARERLLAGVVALCEGDSAGLSRDPRARAVIDQIFLVLVAKAEREVRLHLSERVAGAAWAPKALIDLLAQDDVEIARPVIAHSPLLADGDLIRLLVEATLEHQIEVARRRHIAEGVVDMILERGDPATLAALAHNDTAQISPEAMDQLVDRARRLPALRAPLARHPRLTQSLGVRLYAWVGEALRASMAERFNLDEAALALAVQQAVDDASDLESGHGPPSRPGPCPQQEAAERNLVEKLDAAGQLKGGYLLRSLRENKLTLFEAALARLSGLETIDIRRALWSDRPELLALACMAAGVDQGVFPVILGKVRELNGGRPGGGGEGQKRGLAAFRSCSPRQAAGNFRRILGVI